MNILQEAESLRNLAEEVAKRENITVQEAWNIALKEFKQRHNLK